MASLTRGCHFWIYTKTYQNERYKVFLYPFFFLQKYNHYIEEAIKGFLDANKPKTNQFFYQSFQYTFGIRIHYCPVKKIINERLLP